MWKLRQTWNEVFPAKKLFALDVRVHNIDPAWPITPLPPSSVSTKSIHVNPKFLTMVRGFFYFRLFYDIIIFSCIRDENVAL
jgi:hypothetical protein